MNYIDGNNKNLILVRGTSGSGKSTFASKFLNASLLIATDDFFMNEGVYEFNREHLPANHQRCIDSVKSEMKFRESVAESTNIVVHNTFTRLWEMQPYIDLANKYGYNLHTIIVENRHKSGSIHNVPENAIDDQRARFEVVL
tara:strand:- start:59 stop:484 length:426 start_codon:yes stop_codon:yes gene_type:complete